MSQDHHFFWSGPFSQWHPSAFTLWGCDFATAEQAMMVGKARLFGDADMAAQILAAPDPGKQKALGRQVRGFDGARWDAEKVALVTEISLAKFDQNKGLRRKLFQTGSAYLVEASPLDAVWGIGLAEEQARSMPPESWPGQNLLGKILTDIRETLRARYPDERVAV
ncbi:MAG: NADAR family protein [Pseudomonadota bacterium]